jgi:hypothetical protein
MNKLILLALILTLNHKLRASEKQQSFSAPVTQIHQRGEVFNCDCRTYSVKPDIPFVDYEYWEALVGIQVDQSAGTAYASAKMGTCQNRCRERFYVNVSNIDRRYQFCENSEHREVLGENFPLSSYVNQFSNTWYLNNQPNTEGIALRSYYRVLAEQSPGSYWFGNIFADLTQPWSPYGNSNQAYQYWLPCFTCDQSILEALLNDYESTKQEIANKQKAAHLALMSGNTALYQQINIVIDLLYDQLSTQTDDLADICGYYQLGVL